MDHPLWGYFFRPPKEKKDIIELLKELPAFEGLTENELITIERNLHHRQYRPAEPVFCEGVPGAGLYIVKEGEVSIRKKLDDTKELELALITSRHFFGEMALIDEMPRSASAIAKTATTLLAFSQPDLENIKERNPKLALKIMSNIARLLCQRLVKSNENIENLEKKLSNLRSG
ncbi:MAG: cyclic nucleotide-binding domain-containing protein [Chitinivibrionales bacterium]|nr:cyclic nucleotide-binding domain-containing protein [Chitinivibrionales bacterium]